MKSEAMKIREMECTRRLEERKIKDAELCLSNLDLQRVAEDMNDRIILPLEYLYVAIKHVATEAVDKYEESDNNDAYSLACLLKVFARQLEEITDNGDAIIQAMGRE